MILEGSYKNGWAITLWFMIKKPKALLLFDIQERLDNWV